MYQVPQVLAITGLVWLSTVFVQIRDLKAEEILTTNARGVLRSVREATLATDMSARIVSFPFQTGQSFNKGDLLVAFDCERLEVETQVAAAEARGAKATFDNANHLLAQRAAGALEVAIAKAQADKAQASVEAANVKLKPCRQLAPFAGRVVDVMVHQFDTPAVNAPLIKIVATETVEVDLILPSNWLRWVHVGTPLSFKIDETGQVMPASVSRLGAMVDPVSQTVKAVARLDEKALDKNMALPGMSGTALFQNIQ